MGDLASDHDAAILLIIKEYRKLQSHNPKHELLKYITNVSENGFDNVREKYKEFLDRFESPEDKKLNYVKVTKVLASYYVALRDAVDKINRAGSSQKKEEQKLNFNKSLENELKDLSF